MSNNSKNREVERKFTTPLPYEAIAYRVELLFKDSEVLRCQTVDRYWQIGNRMQFLRLRDSFGSYRDGFSKRLCEVTVKAKDQGNNWNRLEVNLGVEDARKGLTLLTALAGEPIARIHKHELVVFTPEGAVISVSEVRGTTYVEVEAATLATVDELSKEIAKDFGLTLEPRSLFEIYVEPALGGLDAA